MILMESLWGRGNSTAFYYLFLQTPSSGILKLAEILELQNVLTSWNFLLTLEIVTKPINHINNSDFIPNCSVGYH